MKPKVEKAIQADEDIAQLLGLIRYLEISLHAAEKQNNKLLAELKLLYMVQ